MNWDAQKQWRALAEGKASLPLGSFVPGVDLPSQGFTVRSSWEVTFHRTPLRPQRKRSVLLSERTFNGS